MTATTLRVVAAVGALAAAVVNLRRWFRLRHNPRRFAAGVGRSRTTAAAAAVLMLVAATASATSAYLRENERRDCERILTELQSTFSSALADDEGSALGDEGGGGFDSPSYDTSRAMEHRALDLDVAVAEQDSGISESYVVTKGGEVLGTVNEYGIGQNRCEAFAS